MRRHVPLRFVAVGLIFVSGGTIADELIFATVCKQRACATRRVRRYVSLTGLWAGAYRYRWSRGDADGVPFNARLEETGERVSGEIDEPNTFADPSTPRLFASVHGARQGSHVDFIKRYDGSAGQSHSVGYEGQVNADFTRIEGSWSVAGGSGSFFMERADDGAEAAAASAASASA